MLYIKFPIQAEKKYCWYCHFLHDREGYIHPDPDAERYWCNAFTQEVVADKKDRPLRLSDCLVSHISFIDSARLRFKQRIKDELALKAEVGT